MKCFGLTLAQKSICALCGEKIKFGIYQFTDYGAVLICKDCTIE